MAEANQTQQGTQGQGANPAGNNSQGSQQTDQEPKWLSYIQDAKERDEAKKSYLLHADYTKKTQELAEQRKAWEGDQQKYKQYETENAAYKKWLEDNKSFFDAVQAKWDKVQPILYGQGQQSQQAPAQQNNGASPFDNFDVLPAQEQAKAIADYINQNVLTQRFSDFEGKLAQAIAEKEKQFNNSMTVFMEAYNRKLADPSLDIGEYIRKANEFSSGKFNPLDLAYHSLTDEQKMKKMQEEWYKKGKEEALLEAQNNAQTTGAFNNEFVPNFKTQPKSKNEIRDAVRQNAIKSGLGW